MGTTTRQRRIENEWLLLEAQQKANPSRLRLTPLLAPTPDSNALEVLGLPALAAVPIDPAHPDVHSVHTLRIELPRYYPSMPAEVYLDTPVFHPNVHPDTGFVCLWATHRITTSLEQTLAQLQRVLSWQLVNTSPDHVMQPAALAWYQRPEVRQYLPLASNSFSPVHSEAWAAPPAVFRRRLS